jgi:hypothetical protein
MKVPRRAFRGRKLLPEAGQNGEFALGSPYSAPPRTAATTGPLNTFQRTHAPESLSPVAGSSGTPPHDSPYRLRTGHATTADRAEPSPMPRYRTDYSGTLAELRRAVPWFVIWCEGRLPGGYPCLHSGASAVVPHMIRLGPNAPISQMLSAFRCTKCGHKGATMMHPSWGRDNRGAPFPEFPAGRKSG